MEKLRAMVDADTIIGTPIVVGNVTLLPVSKVSFCLATGGSDFPSKSGQQLFGGGGGAGVTVNPVAFISHEMHLPRPTKIAFASSWHESTLV